ncbi:S24 family peptidase [Sphingomonas morindae]|uniref:Helix-turn-helix domain-containing protein n=1 Tax=Sphingomonas morindae TaxID=1541170 RepID=A0ABY4X416_9SPHN|nr:S24 family peptidase [Sphingomonas morindae]USI71638.1 helix-turn-helix domain-containing protein [Sphingomonas morindae]
MQDREMERVREALRRLMEKKGIKAKPLAQQAGLGETAVRDILEARSSDVRVGTLRKLATTLDTSIEELMGTSDVPLSGRVGAGGSVIFEENGHSDRAPRPAGIGGELEALEVIGDSMLPRYSSGDIVYISRTHDGVKEEYLGEYCAARLASGETYIKLLARGSRPGYFTLRSLNAADMEDVELDWASPIISVLPRYARKMLGY